MKFIIQTAMLLGLSVGCTFEHPARPYDAQAARSNIVARLPSGWSVTSPSWEQQRFTTAYFTHLRTEAFMLVGPQSNHLYWRDRKGRYHSENLAKGCLYIWLVPGDFKPRFPHFPSETWGGREIFSSKGIRAYGHETTHIGDTKRLDTIIQEATMTSSPHIRISWASWQQDIKDSLKR